jgi:hypothetical protein
LLIKESDDGCRDLFQALHVSLQDFGLPIPDAPVPSMHDLLSAPPAPIPCDHVQPSSFFLEGDSSPFPVLPSMLVPKSMTKHPRITQQTNPIWATDLRARARQEADEKWVEEHRKEMGREARQHFILHWFDAVSVISCFCQDLTDIIPRSMLLSRWNECLLMILSLWPP